MPVKTIIAVNTTGFPVVLSRLSITIPASGQVTLSDYFRTPELWEADDLTTAINAGSIVINDGVGNLTQSQSLIYLTPPIADRSVDTELDAAATTPAANQLVRWSSGGLLDGIVPSAHASRHNPGGADALTTGAPVAIGDANAEGNAPAIARSNHVHALGGTVNGQLSGTLPNPNVVGIRESGGPTNLSIGAIADGQTLVRSGSTIIGSAGGGFDIRDVVVFDHFMSGNIDTDEIGLMGWRLSVSGTAASIAFDASVQGHPGILNVNTGTNNAGRSAIYLGDTAAGGRILLGGTNPLVMEFLVRFPTSTDYTSLESTFFGLGLGWATNAEPTDGLYFRYTPGVDAFWSLVAANASTRTVLASTTAPIAGNWVRLRVTATASSAQFNINGVNVGSPITTNLPSIGLGIGIQSLGAGSPGSTINIDYILVTQITDKET